MHMLHLRDYITYSNYYYHMFCCYIYGKHAFLRSDNRFRYSISIAHHNEYCFFQAKRQNRCTQDGQNPRVGRLRVSETPTPSRHRATVRHRPSSVNFRQHISPAISWTRLRDARRRDGKRARLSVSWRVRQWDRRGRRHGWTTARPSTTPPSLMAAALWRQFRSARMGLIHMQLSRIRLFIQIRFAVVGTVISQTTQLPKATNVCSRYQRDTVIMLRFCCAMIAMTLLPLWVHSCSSVNRLC